MSTIVLADEQPLIRHAVRQVLEAQGHAIIAELDDGADTLRQTLRLSPSLLILDLLLPRLGGLEVIQRLRQQGSKVPILVLTAQSSEHFAGRCLQAGATGFISKQDEFSELAEAVRSLLHGHSYFPSQWAGSVAPHIGLKAEEEQLRSLSARELTVLRYLANGRSNKEIADELALSDRTVSTYKARIQHKLNVESLAQVLEIAWRQGLLGSVGPAPSVNPVATNALDVALFHKIYDAMHFPVSLRDPDGYVLACNAHFLAFHDLTQEQAIGIRVGDNALLPPDEALKLRARYLDAVARGQASSSDEVIHYRGRRMALRTWQVPYHDPEGKLVGMLCSSVDISAQHQQITELTEARDQGDSFRRSRTLFVFDATDQLLALIRSIEASLQPLVEHLPGNPHVIQTHAQLHTLHQRFQVLMDLVSIERGTLVLMPRVADLGRQTALEAEDYNTGFPPLRPAIQLRPAPPPAKCWCDAQRYRQVLRGLFDYCLGLGLVDLCVECRVSTEAQAQRCWQVRIEPGPTARANGLPSYLDLDQISPQRALCAHLAALMGGGLTFEQPAADVPLALLTLRFPAPA